MCQARGWPTVRGRCREIMLLTLSLPAKCHPTQAASNVWQVKMLMSESPVLGCQACRC